MQLTRMRDLVRFTADAEFHTDSLLMVRVVRCSAGQK